MGGYLEGHPERSTLAGLRSLRTARVLAEGQVSSPLLLKAFNGTQPGNPQVLTIEPGCYFIDFLIDRALADPELSRFTLECQYILYSFLWFRFIVEDRINAYRGTGGVRIEDDIIINANGAELMSIVPR